MTCVRASAPASSHATAALVRFDGRKLLASPWFLVGLGLPAIGTGYFLWAAYTKPVFSWVNDGWMLGVGFFLSAVFSMIAVNRAALRDVREHTREQVESLPVGQATRTVALCAATLWPAAVTTGLFALAVGVAAGRVQLDWAMTLPLLAQTAALVIMLGSLGVATAAWLPNPFVAPVIGLALYIIHPGEVEKSWHSLSPFETFVSPALAGWHVAYLVGLAVLLTSAAARPQAKRVTALAAVAAAALIGVSLAFLLSSGLCASGPCPQ